jgi:peptidoglycan/xylan/chitin deacetylase (PgdA/CDA1 family)
MAPGKIQKKAPAAPTKDTASKNDGKKANAKVKAKVKKVKKEIDPNTRIISSAVANKKNKDGSDIKMVALTFDDGPNPVYTPQILALLKQNNIHATFCLVGRQVKKYPELVKQIVAEGHKVADHSMNHDEFLYKRTDKKLKTEVFDEVALIKSVVPDASVDYFRAPAGNWNYHVRKMAVDWGMKPLGWSVDSKDWTTPGVDSIIETVKAELHPGAVVLMHDAGGNRSETVEALKKLIPTLRADGYQFGFPGVNEVQS